METGLARCLEDPGWRAAIDDAAAALETELQRDLQRAARRRLLRDDLDLTWDSVPLRSLWLVTHRGLRRAGFRRHDASTAVLVTWRGAGLVLARPPGRRQSHTLAPWNAPPSADGERAVLVPAGTPYDTLADATTWHVLVAHSHPAVGLVRRQLVQRDNEESWFELPEEEPS